ncbi:MAG TPA: MFS transporter [Desulfobulbaceae bacterium]|nr:MFS transporter [Desulfobulbaceae bacterium]
MKTAFLPRTVIVLGLVSFLNDTASEMITPLLPIFLTAALGAGPAVVGLVEGIAKATASLIKLVSGRMADKGWNHKGLVTGGYSVSNLARPLTGLALSWNLVLLFRFLDRVGKGLRTSPRDALIAASTDSSRLGRAFGFHRALDNAGAMLGPLCAWYLLRQNIPMAHVFLWSLVPGVLVVCLLIFGLEATPAGKKQQKLPPLRWSVLDHRLRGLILAAGGLALASAPEAFLVLWASDQDLQIAWVPLIWAAASAVKATVAGPAGSLSDRFGRLPVLLCGWTFRILVLLVLAWSCSGPHPMLVWPLFLAYAASLAATEGAERALIGDFAARKERATAFGLYHMVVGLSVLPGAVLFGAIWQIMGSASAFVFNAILSSMAVILLQQQYRRRV